MSKWFNRDQVEAMEEAERQIPCSSCASKDTEIAHLKAEQATSHRLRVEDADAHIREQIADHNVIVALKRDLSALHARIEGVRQEMATVNPFDDLGSWRDKWSKALAPESSS